MTNTFAPFRVLLVLQCYVFLCTATFAETAIPLLGGFDSQRIEGAYPPTSEEASGELAKLLYRLRKVDRTSIEVIAGDGKNLGDAVEVAGTISKISSIQVPTRLHEFLDLTLMQLIVAEREGTQWQIVTANFPTNAKAGDKVAGHGVVIETSESGTKAIAAGSLQWFPDAPESVGWKLLSEAGLDVSLIASASARNRKPLIAEDGDAFYSMLSAAHRIESNPTPDAMQVAPVELLQNPEDFSGQWMQMNLETVQVTRISVTEPARQSQLGSDHYYQIDAMGDLGNVVIKIEAPEGGGKPVTFENRYPVSLVVRELPDFLRQRIRAQEGGDAIVSNLKVMIAVDGFFYRLWSYSTDFMRQRGGGNQFGPLLVAARLYNLEPTSDDPAGVGLIGWIAAVAVLSGILATWAWGRRTASVDRELSQRRKEQQAQNVQLP